MQVLNEDQVGVKLLRDFVTDAGVHCSAGAEYVVDAANAGALILAGVAVKIGESAPISTAKTVG